MLLDLTKKLAESNRVENVHFNFAVSKTLGRIEKEAEITKSCADLTQEMKMFYRKREQLVEELKKKGVEPGEELAQFLKEHAGVVASRKRQMQAYREKLREEVVICPHFIPVYGAEVNGAIREYVPQNILIEDLYNASILLEYVPCGSDLAVPASAHTLLTIPVSVTPEVAMRTSTAIALVGQCLTKDPKNQREFAIRIAWNLFQLYKLNFKVQCDPDYVTWLEEYEVRRVEIIENCSKKNIYGDPERSPNGEYAINASDMDLLNNAMASLDAQKADIVSKYKTLMSTPVKLDMMLVPYEWLPENLTGDQMKVMYNFIEE